MTKEERLALDKANNPILFYGPKDPYGWCSNFHNTSVWMFQPFDGQLVEYATREHRFQAMKATTLEDHEFVRRQPTPTAAKNSGRNILLRDGWGNNYGDLCWFVMFECVLESVIQNKNVKNNLIKTSDSTLYEDSPVDDIWGWRYQTEYTGKNLLGIAWMEVRRILNKKEGA